jgi:hypothetical protein
MPDPVAPITLFSIHSGCQLLDRIERCLNF